MVRPAARTHLFFSTTKNSSLYTFFSQVLFLNNILFIYLLIVIYLAALGLSWGMQDPSCSMQNLVP